MLTRLLPVYVCGAGAGFLCAQSRGRVGTGCAAGFGSQTGRNLHLVSSIVAHCIGAETNNVRKEVRLRKDQPVLLSLRKFAGIVLHSKGRKLSSLSRDQIRSMMAEVLAAQEKTLPADDGARLEDIPFRSLDFSELAVRVEDELDLELNFDAPGLRAIVTIGDVLDFMEMLLKESA